MLLYPINLGRWCWFVPTPKGGAALSCKIAKLYYMRDANKQIMRDELGRGMTAEIRSETLVLTAEESKALTATLLRHHLKLGDTCEELIAFEAPL